MDNMRRTEVLEIGDWRLANLILYFAYTHDHNAYNRQAEKKRTE